MILLLIVFLWAGDVGAETLHDIVSCEGKMEAAMKGREELDALVKPEQNFVTTSEGSMTWGTYNGWHYDDNALYYSYTPSPPDTRTDEDKLADKFKALEQERRDLIERRRREAEAKVARIKKEKRIAELTKLWDEARLCWVTP